MLFEDEGEGYEDETAAETAAAASASSASATDAKKGKSKKVKKEKRGDGGGSGGGGGGVKKEKPKKGSSRKNIPSYKRKKTLERAFGRFSARGKPRIRIARNGFNHTVGYGWVENVLVEQVRGRLLSALAPTPHPRPSLLISLWGQAEAAAAALDGTLSVDGEPIAVSLCTDRRDALCPRLGRQAARAARRAQLPFQLFI